MNKLRLLIVAVIVLGIIFAAQCLYTVKPYEYVVQLRFGGMVEPYRVFKKYNLYLKWPSFIDRYVLIDNRLQVTDAVLETINTSSRQDENFQVAAACSGFWQVKHPKKFYTSLLSTVKESVPEAGSSFPQQVNDKIRDTIRSSVNGVFAETRLSELFGLPEFTGVINQDCLAIDGDTFLPKGLEIHGGEIKRNPQLERKIIGPDGKVIELKDSGLQRTSCLIIVLYGYERESARTSATAPSAADNSYRWIIKRDPAASEGLARKELTLSIPLKYIADKKTTATVQIDRMQKSITERVNAQTLEDYGVEVAQVEIRRLSFPATSLNSVYAKMKSERERISGAYESSGITDASIRLSRARSVASSVVAQAEGDARRIRGSAEARAAEIAAEVQKRDPEFYNWLQSLETAAEIMKNKAWVVLSTDQPVIDALLGKPRQTSSKPKDSKENR
ncbi:MAG: hypothetical protein KAT11_02000 [Phycisphaerae bacterium]|nr:hypothetical protein [Phycisphaerae bacterium]